MQAPIPVPDLHLYRERVRLRVRVRNDGYNFSLQGDTSRRSSDHAVKGGPDRSLAESIFLLSYRSVGRRDAESQSVFRVKDLPVVLFRDTTLVIDLF